MSIIRDALDQIRERAEKATEGPWEWRDEQYPGQLVHRVFLGDPESDDWMERGEVHPHNILKTTEDWVPTAPDATFISHSRTDVPRLVAAVEAVLEVVEQYPGEAGDEVEQFGDAILAALNNKLTVGIQAY